MNKKNVKKKFKLDISRKASAFVSDQDILDPAKPTQNLMTHDETDLT